MRQRSQLKRAKNLCACAIDRTRLMEQLGLRGDPLLPLLPASPLPSPLYCLPSTYFNSSFNFQLGQLSLQVFARCGLRIFFQIKPTLTSASDSELCSGQLPSPFPLPLSAAILAWLNLFNLLRRRRRLLKASATHNNFSHSVGDAARSPQLASNNSNNNKKTRQQPQRQRQRQLATDLHTRKAHLSKPPNELAALAGGMHS